MEAAEKIPPGCGMQPSGTHNHTVLTGKRIAEALVGTCAGGVLLLMVVLDFHDLCEDLSGKQIFQRRNGGIRVAHHAIFYPVQQDTGHSVCVEAGDHLDLVGLEQLLSCLLYTSDAADE